MLVLVIAALLAAPRVTAAPKDVQPVRISGQYPDTRRVSEECRKFRRNGSPVVEAKIRTDGTVGDVRVRRSCGCPAGDRLLVEALKTWKFKPALSDGKPVEVYLTLSISDFWGM
jgi:protein TonB